MAAIDCVGQLGKERNISIPGAGDITYCWHFPVWWQGLLQADDSQRQPGSTCAERKCSGDCRYHLPQKTVRDRGTYVDSDFVCSLSLYLALQKTSKTLFGFAGQNCMKNSCYVCLAEKGEERKRCQKPKRWIKWNLPQTYPRPLRLALAVG